jgi:hypothetical protein
VSSLAFEPGADPLRNAGIEWQGLAGEGGFHRRVVVERVPAVAA